MPEEIKERKKHPFPLIVKEITFSQPYNCCASVSERDDEEIKIKFDNGGGGFFSIIDTKRFAIETGSDTMSKISELCDLICKNNDVIDEQNIEDYGKGSDANEEQARMGIQATPPRTPRARVEDVPF